MADIKSTRAKDSKLEKAMQKHYNLVYEINDISFIRNDNKDTQILGQDLSMKIGSRQYIVDEKCATNYWNRPLNTYSMELSFDMCDKRDGTPIGKRYDGWFVNPCNISSVYSLGYVRAKSESDLADGKLSSFECLIVKKFKIKEYLTQTFGVKDVREIETLFLDKLNNGEIQSDDNGRYHWNINSDVHVVMSSNLAEKSINIVVSKSMLGNLADVHCKIDYSDDGVDYANLKTDML